MLRGIAGEVVETVVRGAMAPYSPLVRRALERGLLVHQARVALSEELAGMVRAVIEAFLRLRVSAKWAKEEVPALRAWMAEDNERGATSPTKASRPRSR